ncbi:MAG: signal transduction histidine kinase [Flavobacteriales bacterium]|jgi:signal transduction histidine kinase
MSSTMSNTSSHISHWAKLTMAGLALGGSYFVFEGLKASGQWWLLILLFIFISLSTLLGIQRIHQWQQGVLGALFLICFVMTLFIHQHITMFYVVVCLLAIETLSKRTAIMWVSLCVLAVFVSELETTELVNLQDAFVNSFLTLFLSGFAFLKLEAEKSRNKTRQLLHELEDKNQQLARYAAEQEQQSRLEERQHLSRELHDTLGHKLTTSIVQLEAAERFVDQNPERVKKILKTLRNLLKEGLNETRNIVRLLDINETAGQSLTDVITPLVNNFQAATGLSVSLRIDSDDTLIAAHYKQHLLRIVQEALTNISRQAEATNVYIKLSVNDVITLLIDDNGVRLKDHHGDSLPSVKSIESRVAELHGKLTFVRDGALTKLGIDIPLQPTGADSAH